MEDRSHHFRKQEFRDLLIELVQLYKPKVYVEIGVAQGYTFNMISDLVKSAIAVDPNMHYIKEKPSVSMYKCTSDEFFNSFNESIDFCFIDGDHDQQQVYWDFQSAYDLLTPNSGLICMHDTYPKNLSCTTPDKCGTAYLAVKRIKKDFYDAEVLTLPGPINGLTIARKNTGRLNMIA